MCLGKQLFLSEWQHFECTVAMVLILQSSKKKSEEYWAAGTGYGHNKRPGDELVIVQVIELAYR